jgi:UDP-N-acetylmuramate dehydrogenase
MALHSSWRAGGRADRFFMPADLEDLRVFLKSLPPDEELLWIGLGSNLLVRDGGIRGTVICTCNRLKRMSLLVSGRIEAQAGVPCALVAKFCADRGLVGGEFLAGIPGTMGGALAMNAGAFGGETWRLVRQVTTIDRLGEIHRRIPDEYDVGYRSVRGPGEEWFVSCELELEIGDGAESRNKIRGLLARRSETQPTQLPSCGSVFRNPVGDFSARLIEASGLKGHTIGGAQVSEKHANFIVNTGNASAADIEALLMHVKAEVFRRHGVELMPEVKIVGCPVEESR